MTRILILTLILTCFSVASEKPNILWFVVEDMSQDLGCYGNKAVSTPNLDRLARKGMKFNNMFTS